MGVSYVRGIMDGVRQPRDCTTSDLSVWIIFCKHTPIYAQKEQLEAGLGTLGMRLSSSPPSLKPQADTPEDICGSLQSSFQSSPISLSTEPASDRCAPAAPVLHYREGYTLLPTSF